MGLSRKVIYLTYWGSPLDFGGGHVSPSDVCRHLVFVRFFVQDLGFDLAHALLCTIFHTGTRVRSNSCAALYEISYRSRPRSTSCASLCDFSFRVTPW